MIYSLTLIIYLIVLVGVGAYKSKRVKTQEDFSVAGRQLSVWVLVGTMLATWIGTGTIFGSAGKTFDVGIANIFIPLGGVLGIFVLTKIAARVRRFEKFTVLDILEDRYGRAAKYLGMLTLISAYVVIVSYQYNAGASVIQMVMGDSLKKYFSDAEMASLVITAGFIILYTMLAGLFSVAYTDVANGIIMSVGILVTMIFLFFKAGGWNGAENMYLQTGRTEHLELFGRFSWIELISFTLPTFLLVMGDANMYQRFFAAKNEKSATRATQILIWGVLFIEVAVVLCAFFASAFLPHSEKGKYIMVYAAFELMPPMLGALLLAAIVAIIVSTADSYLLVPATTIVREIASSPINRGTRNDRVIFWSRIIVLILGVIAFYLSIKMRNESFFNRALYAYTIYGAGITPALIAAFFWKRVTRQGAVASIISGTLVTILWSEKLGLEKPLMQTLWNKLHIIDASQITNEVLPAILVSMLALVSVSLMTNLRTRIKK